MELPEINDCTANRKKRTPISRQKVDMIKIMRYEGDSVQKIARVLQLSIPVIYKWISVLQDCEIGNDSLDKFFKSSGPKHKGLTETVLKVGECIQDDATLTQKGIANTLALRGINISQSTVSSHLKKLGLTRKRLKRVSEKTVSSDVIAKRKLFALKYRNQSDNNILFLDETGFNLHVSRKYGYSPKNLPAFKLVPANRGRNVSLLAIISNERIIHVKLLEGAYNTNMFLVFLQECFDLHIFGPEKRIVMDNVKFHKSFAVQNWFSGKKVLYDYLPPYSPQLNPIEEVFSTLKSRYHGIKPLARNAKDIMNYVTRVVQDMNGTDGVCFGNYYRNMRRYLDLAFSGSDFMSL